MKYLLLILSFCLIGCNKSPTELERYRCQDFFARAGYGAAYISKGKEHTRFLYSEATEENAFYCCNTEYGAHSSWEHCVEMDKIPKDLEILNKFYDLKTSKKQEEKAKDKCVSGEGKK